MVNSQPHRSGAVQAWWAHTGSTNRGFVSLDPERQREVDTETPARKRSSNALRFDVRRAAAAARAGRGKGAAKKSGTSAGPEGGAVPPADEGRRH